jgi:DNA-binding NtrC family response regulator
VKEMLEVLVAEMVEQKVLLEDAVKEFEKQFLQAALRRSGGNQCKAAQLLHIHRNTLARKIVQTKLKTSDEPSKNRRRTLSRL